MDKDQQKIVVRTLQIAGVICLISGFVLFAAVTPILMVSHEPFSDMTPIVVNAVTGFLMFAGGGGLLVLAAVLSRNWGLMFDSLVRLSSAHVQHGGYFAPQPQKPVERIIIKEIVKVKCPYCGHLVESTESTCPNCHGDM